MNEVVYIFKLNMENKNIVEKIKFKVRFKI